MASEIGVSVNNEEQAEIVAKAKERELWRNQRRGKLVEMLSSSEYRERTIEWMLDTEQKLREYDEHMRKQREQREEIRERLGAIDTIESRIAEQMNALIETVTTHMNDLLNRVTALHQATMQTEGKIAAMWNTLNTVVQLSVDIFSGKRTLGAQIMEVAGGIQKITFHSSVDEVQAWLKETGQALFKEAHEHHRSELARARQQQKEGKKPDPIASLPRSPGLQLIADVTEAMKVAKEKDKDDASRG